MITIRIHTIIGLKEVLGRGMIEFPVPPRTTVGTLLALMIEKWGTKLSGYFSDFDCAGPLPRVRILVNGQDIAFLSGSGTELQEGDEILLLPMVGGG